MLTPEIKQAWLDWLTQTIDNYKNCDIEDFAQANEFKLSPDDEIDLIDIELVVRFKDKEEINEIENNLKNIITEVNDLRVFAQKEGNGRFNHMLNRISNNIASSVWHIRECLKKIKE